MLVLCLYLYLFSTLSSSCWTTCHDEVESRRNVHVCKKIPGGIDDSREEETHIKRSIDQPYICLCGDCSVRQPGVERHIPPVVVMAVERLLIEFIVISMR